MTFDANLKTIHDDKSHCLSLLIAYKPKFAEPKKTVSENADRYDRDFSHRGRYDDRDRDRDERYDRRGGAPGGYPYNDRDRGNVSLYVHSFYFLFNSSELYTLVLIGICSHDFDFLPCFTLE